MEPATPPGEGTIRRHLEELAIADPEAAGILRARLTGSAPPDLTDGIARAVPAVIAALCVEISYGRTLADGLGRLLAADAMDRLPDYIDRTAEAAQKGPTLASLFARHLVPVLLSGDHGLDDRFETTTQRMLKKGTYTLKAPLETLSRLVDEGDAAAAHAFLDLLDVTYALDISYNRCVYLTHTLPRAVDGFVPSRRLWQIRGLTRVMRLDEHLADDYLQGLEAGLGLLSEAELAQFLDRADARYRSDRQAAAHFLSLESRYGETICRELQTAVPLSAVRADLKRYLKARTGLAVAVRAFSPLPGADAAAMQPLVAGDGQAVTLPEEMACLAERAQNAGLYKLLVRLEAGAIEFGTFEMDADKVFAPTAASVSGDEQGSDLARFLARFPLPELALDLFTLFEHSRIAGQVRRRYPALHRRLCRAMLDDHLQSQCGCRPGGTLYPLYRHLVAAAEPPASARLRDLAERHARAASWTDADVEASARLAGECYGMLAPAAGEAYVPLTPPFGRRFHPHTFRPFHTAYHDQAGEIRQRLAAAGVRVYRSDVRHLLVRHDGRLTADDLRLLASPSAGQNTSNATATLSTSDLAAMLCEAATDPASGDAPTDDAFRYDEWDDCTGDYLPDRVRVRVQRLEGTDIGFYHQTLDRFRGLVKRIRYAFELLRPQEITILRQWREGDAFDYRALLDYAVDRKAGLMPSDRLFIKRMKRIRDVAALLLVDLSRSTANTVDGRGTRVLDVEKQAIVLLCEALQVVGDRFAIAGFSGTGPLGVDYYRVKDLDAPFDDRAKMGIGAMAPQRNTRMGAAIRHATAMLAPVAAKVRLILILGDGFPNDLAYKGAYAVEDTRRAVTEARAANVHVKAITVNVRDNGQLDRLYGPSHHTLIGDVRDLPDRLVRVYSALTRH